MPAYRSTRLKLVADHCPAALDHLDAGVPYDRRVFEPGIAAHAVLERVGTALASGRTFHDNTVAEIADQTVRALVTKGRSFDGVPEPPMSVDNAARGRQLAMDWLLMNPLSPSAKYEHGLAINARGEPVPYDSPDAWYRAALDVLDVIEDTDDDGYGTTTVVVRDWKSAPPTDASELDTTQIRGQALLAVAAHPHATIVRREVVNLWKRRSWSADLVLDDDGRAQIEQWRRDIGHQIAAAEVRGPDGKRPAQPGGGCYGCPFLLHCDAARAFFAGTMLAKRDGFLDDPRFLAQRYSVARAVTAELAGLAREAAKESPVDIGGGWVVGYEPKPRRVAKDGAHRTLAHAWHQVEGDGVREQWDAEHQEELGLLAAMKLTGANLNGALVQLVPSRGGGDDWRERRDALRDELTETVTTAEFSVFKPAAVSLGDTDNYQLTSDGDV